MSRTIFGTIFGTMQLFFSSKFRKSPTDNAVYRACDLYVRKAHTVRLYFSVNKVEGFLDIIDFLFGNVDYIADTPRIDNGVRCRFHDLHTVESLQER